MAGGIKVSKPERLPKENVSEPDLYAWWNELMNYLNQHDNFKLYKEKGMYSQWQPAELEEDRIVALHKDDKDGNLDERQRDLNNFITIIAGCCSRDQYMMVIKQATSLKWIWNELTIIYQHQHKGKEFLSITDLEYNPSQHTPLSFYNSYRAKVMENLKPSGTTVKWKNGQTLKSAETMSPTFEDHILLTTLLIIDKRLPSKIKEVYGPRLGEGNFLMDLKVDILTNAPKLLEDLEAENNINVMKPHEVPDCNIAYMGQNSYRRGRGRGRNNFYPRQQKAAGSKFCRLCHLARQPRNVVLSHEIGDLDCPSISSRDKEGLKSKYSTHAAVRVDDDVEDPDLIDKMAQLHGYDDQVKPKKQTQFDTNTAMLKNDDSPTLIKNNISVIKPVPSQILTVFQNETPIHIDLDSGCWISSVKLEFVEKMKWKIHPNGQLAKMADGKTMMHSKGEIHETFHRNAWTVQFSAIVMDTLHTNVIGGNNFFLDNKVKQDFSAKNITVHNKYVVPETNRYTDLPTYPINTIIATSKATTLLPNQTLLIDVPPSVQEKSVLIESMQSRKDCHILPQISSIENGKLPLVNLHKQPIELNKDKLLIKSIKEVKVADEQPQYQMSNVQVNVCIDSTKDIITNYERLNDTQQKRLQEIIEVHHEVFDQDLSKGYNQYSGPHFCKLKFANEERPSSRKVSCIQYNTKMNVLLQQVCDELTQADVLGIPQHENVEVQHVMPIFLRKKQKAREKSNSELTTSDVRLVVNTCELSKYMKSLPGKVSKPQDVYNAIAKWKFIIKTDLYQGFFQNHLHKDAQKWCGILTPYGGLRFFKRGIQGLINQSEELDELLAKLFGDMMTKGKLVKIADDLFTGGNTIEETLDNFNEMLNICLNNNMKLSPTKTIIMPKTVDIMSWIWSEGGTLAPSPHRKQALLKINQDDLKTVKDIRSWSGLYKTFLYHTPNLAKILDPFDKITGDKDSKDSIVWTTELQQAFQQAKDHISNIQEVYLPHPDDQLIIITDGARNPPGVGFVLQATDSKGKIRTVRHYSVKLKPHHLKWSPCEIESVAFGTAIEAFYDVIKESNKPVIICPDSKPVCDASKLLQKGKFSLSPRIQTFLNNMGKISCEIQHISGKSGQNMIADFQSRNTPTCTSEICQLCKYIDEQSETIIDTKINAITPEIPYGQRETWAKVQKLDKAINLARSALTTGQLISKKSGKVNADARKILKNATIADDGLLVVHRTVPYTTEKEERIVVPTSYIPTLLNQIHNENNHPSKHQMKHLFERYFYGACIQNIIEEICDKCQTCCSIKKLPTTTHYSTTTNAKAPGTHFGCDVLKRAKQNIMVVRDQFSSYTLADFVENETSEVLEEAIIRIITPVRNSNKVIIRTDQATGFCKAQKSVHLKELGIEIETGSSLNKNSNAVVDKGMQELEKEITILQPTEKPISIATLSKAVINLNNRLRRSGLLSAKDILFSRDEKRQVNINLDDKLLARQQLESREKSNDIINMKNTGKCSDIQPGNSVMLNKNPKKHNVRETFHVLGEDGQKITIKKGKAGTRNKVYTVLKHDVFKVNVDNPHRPKLRSQPTRYADYDPIKRHSSSDDDSDTDTCNLPTNNNSQSVNSREIHVSEDIQLEHTSDDETSKETPERVNITTQNNINDPSAYVNPREINFSEENISMSTSNEELPNENSARTSSYLGEASASEDRNPMSAIMVDANNQNSARTSNYLGEASASEDRNPMSANMVDANNHVPDTDPHRFQHILEPITGHDIDHGSIPMDTCEEQHPALLGAIPKVRIKEKWTIPKKTKDIQTLRQLKRTIAATIIQNWYRRHSKSKRKYFLRSRNLKTPENLRDDEHSVEYVISSAECEREIPSRETSIDTLEWDGVEKCTDFYDEFNDAFLLPGLDIQYSRMGTGNDLMRVYDFSNALPISSELLPKKKSSKKIFKPLKVLRAKLKGATPVKRQ